MVLFGKDKVMQFLPHRDPFLFVDSVISVELEGWTYGKGIVTQKEVLGTTVTATFHVSEKLDLFQGHFPGKPILPGVIQVEMMAQASSFIFVTLLEDPFTLGPDLAPKMDVALTTISNAKFRKPVTPGMDLTIKATCTKFRGPMMASDCHLFHAGQLVSEASVLASVRF